MTTTQWSLHAKERLYQRYGYTYVQEPLKQIPQLLDKRIKDLEKEKIEKILDRVEPRFLVRLNFYDLDSKVYLIYDLVDSLIVTVLPPNCLRYSGEVPESRTIALRRMLRINITVNKRDRVDQISLGDKYLYAVHFSRYSRGPNQATDIDLLSLGQEDHEKRKWIFAANSSAEVEEYLHREILKENERVWVRRLFVAKPTDPQPIILNK